MFSALGKPREALDCLYQALAHAVLRDLTNYYYWQELQEAERRYQLEIQEKCTSEVDDWTDEVFIDNESRLEESVQDGVFTGRKNAAASIKVEDTQNKCKFELNEVCSENFDKECEKDFEKLYEDYLVEAFGDNIHHEEKKKEYSLSTEYDLENWSILNNKSNGLTGEKVNKHFFCEGDLVSLGENKNYKGSDTKKKSKLLIKNQITDENYLKGIDLLDSLLKKQKSDIEREDCHPCIVQRPLCYNQNFAVYKYVSSESNFSDCNKHVIKLPTEISTTKDSVDETKSLEESMQNPFLLNELSIAKFENNSCDKMKTTNQLEFQTETLIPELYSNELNEPGVNRSSLCFTEKEYMKHEDTTDILTNTAGTQLNKDYFAKLLSKALGEDSESDKGELCECSRKHGCLHSVEWDDSDDSASLEQVGLAENSSVSDWLYRSAICLQQPTQSVTNTSETQTQGLQDSYQPETDQIEDYAKMLFVNQWVDETQMYCSTHSPKYGCGDTTFSTN